MYSYLSVRSIKCGRCGKSHSIPPSDDDRTADEILTLVKSIPTAVGWTKSIERNQVLLQLHAHEMAQAGTSKKAKVAPCAEDHCQADATHMCTECGTQCDACQKKSHSTPVGSSHMCVSFVEQKRKKQLTLQEAAAEKRLNRYGPFIAAVAKYEAKLADDSAFGMLKQAWAGEADHRLESVPRVGCCLCTPLMHAICLVSSCPAVCRRSDEIEGRGRSGGAAASVGHRVEESK
jgi:hypothetical protein